MQVWSESLYWSKVLRKETPFWTFQNASVTLKIRSRSSKSYQLFPFSQQCIYRSLVKVHQWFRRYRTETIFIQSAGVTLKIRSMSLKSKQLFPFSQQCIVASLVKIQLLVQKITHHILDTSKCNCDLVNQVKVTKI